MNFLQQMEAQIEAAKNAVLDTCVEMATYTFSIAIRHSPVLTSNFIQNYNIGPTADFSYVQHAGGQVSVQGAKSVLLSEINSKVNRELFRKSGQVFMTNATPYSDNIEDIGWSRTAAYAPIGSAVTAFSAKYS